MPQTNTLLLIGLGLAALTLFRRDQAVTDETDLVEASMLSQNSGRTGKLEGFIPTVGAESPINLAPISGSASGNTGGSLWDVLFGPTGAAVQSSTNASNGAPAPVVNTDLPNMPVGQIPAVNVPEFKQTPAYIRTTGELAGSSVRQIGLTKDVDLLNPKIYVNRIEIDDVHSTRPPLTTDENVQIVAGGANPGDPYWTTLDVVKAARDVGMFDPIEPDVTNEFGFVVDASNTWDVAAYQEYQGAIMEAVTPTGGIPLYVEPSTNLDREWAAWGEGI